MSLTLIIGASFSGTSMIAHVCHANGAWMGEILTEPPEEYRESQHYDLYENITFRSLCRNALNIDTEIDKKSLDKLFKAFFVSLPTDSECVVLKYPKAFYLLPALRDKLQVEPKLVNVIRNPFRRAFSYVQRTQVFNVPYALMEWDQAYMQAAEATDGLDMYTILYERFLKEPEMEAKQLFDFIGLKPEKVDVSMVDTGKRHF